MNGFIHITAQKDGGIDCKCRLGMVTLYDQIRILLIVYQSLRFNPADIVKLAPVLEAMLDHQKADGNITTVEAKNKSDSPIDKMLWQLLGREDKEEQQ